MQCKDVAIGQRFTSNGVTMTRIDVRVFAPLLGHRGLDTHTFDIHVFAVDADNQLHAPHRDNSCELVDPGHWAEYDEQQAERATK